MPDTHAQPGTLAVAIATLTTAVNALAEKVGAPERLTLRRDELATAMGIGLSTLANLEASGGVGPEPIRIGRVVLYDLIECREWVAAKCPVRLRWLAIRQSQIRRAS